jgi:ribosomal protein S27AE
MAVKQYYASAEQTIRLDRECSKCGNRWNEEVTVFGGSSSGSRTHARRTAAADLAARLPSAGMNVKHRCPRCSAFSVEAHAVHFSGGVRQGLMKKYSKACAADLVSIGKYWAWPIIALIVVSIVLANGAATASDIADIFVPSGGKTLLVYGVTAALAFGVCGGLIRALVVFKSYQLRSALDAALSKMSETEIEAIALACYRAARDSFTVNAGEGMRARSAWIEIPLRQAHVTPSP